MIDMVAHGIKRRQYENSRKWKIGQASTEKCKICGLGTIEHNFAICNYCGWESDELQNEQPDYIGGANHMSFNQYKKFWENNKEDILKHESDLPNYAFKKSEEYYEKKLQTTK